jgi:hypothetical protein
MSIGMIKYGTDDNRLRGPEDDFILYKMFQEDYMTCTLLQMPLSTYIYKV